MVLPRHAPRRLRHMEAGEEAVFRSEPQWSCSPRPPQQGPRPQLHSQQGPEPQQPESQQPESQPELPRSPAATGSAATAVVVAVAVAILAFAFTGAYSKAKAIAAFAIIGTAATTDVAPIA